MIRNLLCDLAGKNLRLGEKSKHMSQKTTRDKLLSYLSSEMHRHGSNEFDIPFPDSSSLTFCPWTAVDCLLNLAG